MPHVHYRVRATMPTESIRNEYVEWLLGGHVQAVKAGGASDARVIAIESEPGHVSLVIETHYMFPTVAAFDHYVAGVAPGLRAEGLARFGPERGVRMERTRGIELTEP